MIDMDDLNQHLKNHLIAHEQLNRQIVEIAGTIKFIQKLLAIAEQKNAAEQQTQGANENGGVNGEEAEQVA